MSQPWEGGPERLLVVWSGCCHERNETRTIAVDEWRVRLEGSQYVLRYRRNGRARVERGFQLFGRVPA